MGGEGGVIRRLHVKDFAIVKELEVEFGAGLNVITGETGAGKSILIEALGLILGGRASGEMIRTGSPTAIVEGLFELRGSDPLLSFLKDLGLDLDDDNLLIRREISRNGRGRCLVNGSPITISMLRKIGDMIVDLHGQHEHQSLLNVERHIDFLDEFGGLLPLRCRVESLFEEYKRVTVRLGELLDRASAAKEKKELLEFQLKEIEGVNPQPGEEEALERERRVLENCEKLFQATSDLFEWVYQRDGSIIERLGVVRGYLEEMSRIDPEVKVNLEYCDSAIYNLEELSRFLQEYKNGLEFNPIRLEEIRDRLGALSRLKKKYGGTMEAMLEYREWIKGELGSLENLDGEIASLREKVEIKKEQLAELCCQLSEQRKSKALELQSLVERELSELGMGKAQFEVSIGWVEDATGPVEIEGKPYWVGPKGLDRMEFYISPNVGEELKPLIKIASGGEISRIMLALKSALAKVDHTPTLVFDEIDIGIGGRIAQAVGEKLKGLSKAHQIICITHLPQIASLADEHFSVSKRVKDGRTVTSIKSLNPQERTQEIARLLGGREVTEITIKYAQEMLERARGLGY